MNICRSFIFLLSLLIISISLNGQSTKTNYTKHQLEFNSKAESLGISKYSFDRFYKYKININELDKFKKLGVDLIELSNATPAGFLQMSLFSVSVVRGTIIEKKYHPGKENYFHTTYKVKVDEVLKGNISSKIIEIKTVSGLVDQDTGTYEKLIQEPVFFVGEEGLFFVDRFDRKYFEEGRKYSVILQDKKFNIESNQFTIQDKYMIKESYVLNRRKEIVDKVDVVSSKLRKLEEINNIVGFSNRKF